MIPPLGPGAFVASRYEILSLLGTGGMGVVFKARDHSLDDVVALKVLRSGADLDLVRRFRSEVKLAHKVHHKNVCAIHDYGEDGERLYISMELVEGTDLKRLLHDQGALFRDEAYGYALQIVEGLRAIHDEGIIHRDLKPANVMKDQKGVVRVMDFGIAKLGVGGAPDLTGEGKVVGSPEYMSPEQVRGGAGLDFRSDLYSLGIVIYELFAGRVPFRAEDAFATMRKHLFEEPSFDDEEGSTFPPALVPLLRKALAKSPEERYSSCAEMIDALRASREASGELSTDEVPPPSSGNTPTRLVTGLARKSPQPYPPQARLLIPTLVRALKSPDSEVRLGAAIALGHTPDESARPALRDAFATEVDSEVRRRVGDALHTLDAPAAPSASLARDERPTTGIEQPLPMTPPSPPVPAVVPALAPPRPPDIAPPRPPDIAPSRRPDLAPTRALWWIAVVVAAAIGIGTWWRAHERASFVPAAAPPTPSPLTAPPAGVLPDAPAPDPTAKATPEPTKAPSAPRDSARARPPTTTVPAPPGREPGRIAPDPSPVTTLVVLPVTEAPPDLVVSPPPLAAGPPPTEPAPAPPTEPAPIPEPGVDPPVCVRCPAPDYPLTAVRLRRAGTVVLRALIDENGRVAEVKVIRAVEWLTEAAVSSVRKRTYRPASRQGAPVKAWIEVPIRFDLPR